jgi:hydrogenase expression/formation protein HypD
MADMDLFSDPVLTRNSVEAVIDLAKRFKEEKGRIPVFMEVCGSHTMALAKTGIKSRLKDYVQLIATGMSCMCYRSKVDRCNDPIIRRA